MSEAKFNKAVSIVQNLPKDGPMQPTIDDKLYFYQYYKQATIGDNNTAKPGFLDFQGRTKWDAWTSVKGTSKEEARAKYVAKLLELLNSASDEQSKKYVEEIEAA